MCGWIRSLFRNHISYVVSILISSAFIINTWNIYKNLLSEGHPWHMYIHTPFTAFSSLKLTLIRAHPFSITEAYWNDCKSDLTLNLCPDIVVWSVQTGHVSLLAYWNQSRCVWFYSSGEEDQASTEHSAFFIICIINPV